MRLCYPANDTPVFTCPSISTSDYDWKRTTVGKKVFLRVQSIGLLAIVLYSFLVSYAHRWITWDDFTWPFVWQVLKSLGIVALFPLIVIPVMILFSSRHGQLQRGYPKHRFFREWASVFRMPAKGGGYTNFFIEDVENFNLRRTFFGPESIYMANVRFKRKWVFRRGDERFILRVPDEMELQPFLNWARANQIAISFAPQEENHRLS